MIGFLLFVLFLSETKIENLAGAHTKSYRVEEVPADQLQVADNEMLVPVGHYQKEPYSAFGNPFLIKVKEGENFDGVKERIQVIKQGGQYLTNELLESL